MPAGTITLTSGSTAVTGTGTNFATELKVNDLMVAVVGGVTYTLGVQAIGSATALTLTTAFNGPTSSGLAWTALPNAALVGITAQVAADVAKAIRGFNFDKVNWQKIFSSDTSVTVTLPDLTKFIGPSWGYLSTQLSNSLTKDGNLGGLADKVTARENLGLGDSSTKNVGTDADSVMAGDAGLLKSGGTMTGGITMAGNTGIDLSGSNISRINVMSWISTAAARASLAAAGFHNHHQLFLICRAQAELCE
ncbi:hypothetical protein HA45_10430 [Pantoea rodasii]|uniref:hypothetical protein n=1 Tax=Pantoea rodasii TaxID=1076549 RepID=UPI000A23F01D|nr:hypothetical protein [Pantoea rodasii]ORM64242.1 hypothetical protein HA45_10430 [Pantoea rodasii]